MRYFIVAAFVFFMSWIIVVGLTKTIVVTFSSGETITAFFFGGFIFIVLWTLLLALWNKLADEQKQQQQNNNDTRRVRDRILDTYISNVEGAKSIEEIDRLEKRLKSAL